MEIATQDEGALTRTPDAGRRALLLDRSRSLGAKWVRVNLYWGKDDVDAAHLGVILGAVAAIKAAGFEVQATLTGGSEDWTGGRGVEPSPAAFASFVASVVPALSAAGVWRYSIWNEPNHPAFLAAGPHARSYVAKVARAKALGAAAATQTGATKRETLREAKALSHAASAIFARKIFAANARLYSKLYAGGYRAVKAAQPGAQVLFGELSTFRALEFLERAIRGRRLRADGFALHPYQYRVAPEKRDGDTGGGIGNIDRIAQKLEELAHARALRDATGHPVKLFLTEFGYHRLEYGDGSGVHRAQTSDKRLVPERKRALWTPRAFERARRFGAAEMLVYHLYPCDVRGTLPVAWDSSVLDFDGSPTASYQSLQAWARKHHYPGVP